MSLSVLTSKIRSEENLLSFAIYYKFIQKGFLPETPLDSLDFISDIFRCDFVYKTSVIHMKSLLFRPIGKIKVFAQVHNDKRIFNTELCLPSFRRDEVSEENIIKTAESLKETFGTKISSEIIEKLFPREKEIRESSILTLPLYKTLRTVLSTEPRRSAPEMCSLLIHSILLLEGFQSIQTKINREASFYHFEYAIEIGEKPLLFTVRIVQMLKTLIVNASQVDEKGNRVAGSPLYRVPIDYTQYAHREEVSLDEIDHLESFVSVVRNAVVKRLKYPENILVAEKGKGLKELSPDLLFHVLGFLGGKDLANVSRVCALFRFASNAPFLWKNLCIRELKNSSQMSSTSHWKTEFIVRYLENKPQIPLRSYLYVPIELPQLFEPYFLYFED